jgi:hypothetical protein
MRQHRVRGIPEQRQAATRPGRQRLAVVQRPSKRLFNLIQQRPDARVPAFELAAQHVGISGRRP